MLFKTYFNTVEPGASDPQANSAAAEFARQGSLKTIKAKRILIVDDDIDLSEAMRYLFLSIFGAKQIDVAHDPCDAMNQLIQKPYDLVALDWNLPGLSGPELIQQVDRYFDENPRSYFRAAHKWTPIVIVSGYNEVEMPGPPPRHFGYVGRISKKQKLGEIIEQFKNLMT